MEVRRRRTKVTVVTGMLNAGKTTFIRNALLFENSGRKKSEGFDEKRTTKKEKIAILVNEFGSLGIDGAILEAVQAKKGGGDDDDVSAGPSVFVDEFHGLLIDHGIDDLVKGFVDDGLDLLHFPTGDQGGHVVTHAFHLIVISAR